MCTCCATTPGSASMGLVADPSNLAAWHWTVDVNLWGVINGCKVFLPGMIEHGEPCHIVNTASLAGLGSQPTTGAYNISKHGVVALSETLAMEMRLSGDVGRGLSRVPGFVATRIGESRRNMPIDVRAAVAPVSASAARGSDASAGLIAQGLTAVTVARAVHDAVRTTTSGYSPMKRRRRAFSSVPETSSTASTRRRPRCAMDPCGNLPARQRSSPARRAVSVSKWLTDSPEPA